MLENDGGRLQVVVFWVEMLRVFGRVDTPNDERKIHLEESVVFLHSEGNGT